MNDPDQNIVGKRVAGTFEGVGWANFTAGRLVSDNGAQVGDLAVYRNISVPEPEVIERARFLLAMIHGVKLESIETEDVMEFMDSVGASGLVLVGMIYECERCDQIIVKTANGIWLHQDSGELRCDREDKMPFVAEPKGRFR